MELFVLFYVFWKNSAKYANDHLLQNTPRGQITKKACPLRRSGTSSGGIWDVPH